MTLYNRKRCLSYKSNDKLLSDIHNNILFVKKNIEKSCLNPSLQQHDVLIINQDQSLFSIPWIILQKVMIVSCQILQCELSFSFHVCC